jgi:hypothetical protein
MIFVRRFCFSARRVREGPVLLSIFSMPHDSLYKALSNHSEMLDTFHLSEDCVRFSTGTAEDERNRVTSDREIQSISDIRISGNKGLQIANN